VTRRPCTVTQADVARVIRAAKQAGASAVEVRIGNDSVITVRLTAASSSESSPEQSQDIVL
jgi:hypothetical protein